MNRRSIRRAIVDQDQRDEILEERFGAANVERVTVSQKHSLQPIYACRMQIGTKHALVIAATTTIKQPVAVRGTQMNSCARADVQHRDFCTERSRPMQILEVIMTAGELREPLNKRDDRARKRPVRVVKNQRQA